MLLNKKRLFTSAIVAGTMIASLLGSTGCSSKKETDYDIQVVQETVEYTKSGDPVDPLTLVAITRKADSDKKSTEKQTSTNEETSKKSEKATKATVEKGLKVTKVYPQVIDTSQLGEVEVKFTVKDTDNHDSTKELSAKFTVVDSTAPTFKLSDKKAAINAGDTFDPAAYIKDDAGLKKVDAEPEKNSDGKYDEGWYTIDSNVKTDTAGDYTVIYHAVSAEGNVTEATLKVTVNEAKETKTESDTSTKKTQTQKSQKSAKGNTNTQTAAASSSSSESSIPSSGTDSYNGVIQTDGCEKVKVHHDAITETKQIEHWSDPVVEVWYKFSDGTEFSSYDEASAYQSSNNAGSFISFLKTVQESQCTYETVEEVVVPAYDEYVCK